MIHKTDADKFFCPLSFNGPVGSIRCEGAMCMAWRTTKEHGIGYCGMAGKPSEVLLEEAKALVDRLMEVYLKVQQSV